MAVLHLEEVLIKMFSARKSATVNAIKHAGAAILLLRVISPLPVGRCRRVDPDTGTKLVMSCVGYFRYFSSASGSSVVDYHSCAPSFPISTSPWRGSVPIR